MRIALCIAAAALSLGAAAERTSLPARAVRGDTNIRRLAPFDSAAWIWAKDRAMPQGGEFLRFRCKFLADGRSPLKFHVSADERFVLLLDGEVVARGPDRGDVECWFAQSYALAAPATGEHVFEAVCWRVGSHAPNAQLSWRGGFIFKAEGVYDRALTTGVAGWRVATLSGTQMTRWKYPANYVGSQCEVSGTGILDERPDDSAYAKPVVVRAPVPPDDTPWLGQLRSPGWMLYPTELPEQLSRTIRPGAFRAADDQAFSTNGVWSKVGKCYGSNGWYRASSAIHPAVAQANALLAGGAAMTVPPRTRLRLLWDLGDYYCAYPMLSVSGGKGARVAWGWAESLYVGDCFDWHTVVSGKERKGSSNRAEFVDKYFYGNADTFLPDGRELAKFTSPWWRCGRWCQIEVETAGEPLVIKDAHVVETRYPFEPRGYFRCDDPTLGAVWNLCVRGLEMCMHEMYFDCPYYEQQMYPGDSRVQMLVAAAISPDDRLTRQSIRILERSQRDDGMISMDYPTRLLHESATYSLIWAMMLGDYAMWRDDADWLRARMPSVRKLLFAVERYIGADGLLRRMPGWAFTDWVPDWDRGVAPDGESASNPSAANNLLYACALMSAARAEEACGEAELAARWRDRAARTVEAATAAFWNEERGMLADEISKRSYSEHVQCLALLTGLLGESRERRVFDALVTATDLARCTVYFSHYLFETYCRRGRGDLFLRRLDLWRDFVRQGLKTPLEGPGDARSDCHGWGAHPVFHLLTGVAGIRPASPGFRTVEIAPSPGALRHIEAGVPSPRGMVSVRLDFSDGAATGRITLPKGMTGVFLWNSRRIPLLPGENDIM